MKLDALLETDRGLTPKQVLLGVQRLLLEEHSGIDIELDNKPRKPNWGDTLNLTATIADLDVGVVILKDESSSNGMHSVCVEVGPTSSTWSDATFTEESIKRIYDMLIEKLIENMYEHASWPQDGSPAMLTKWFQGKFAELFKRLEDGELKSAKHVYVEYLRNVANGRSVDERAQELIAGREQLKAEHNAVEFASKQVPGRVYYIFTKLP